MGCGSSIFFFNILECQKYSVTVPKWHCTEHVRLLVFLSPLQAEACKSVEYAMKKCPNGMYSEVKYDGERVQVHKRGSEFKYFSRSLKPVLPHKVSDKCKCTVL
jgi:DNA ligase-3